MDSVGSGIRRMFQTQRDRFFPLPDYVTDAPGHSPPRVEVTIHGRLFNINYTLLLMTREDLQLSEVFLLDRVQKKKALEPEDVDRLRARKLIEGRVPNLYVSVKARSGGGH
ncbi:MAG: hypothetical protein FWD68_03360 [Alphaproteobacteria bacterium]|nr:hypothetical protein [Alphaproteobacteria bacterium]